MQAIVTLLKPIDEKKRKSFILATAEVHHQVLITLGQQLTTFFNKLGTIS
ncbi:MAG: hypothetical protein HQM12_05705 [SAR324 cluster bacterium]|nr:hypothetical protein [SAR324 cluster bacterium]